MSNSDVNFFNPEDTAKLIMLKSVLPKREKQRQSGYGSQFFKDNRIRSCSFVKDAQGGQKAVGFYDKRNNDIYPTHSVIKRSWTSSVHSNKGEQCAGMGNTKSLLPYDPKAVRNSMNVPSFKPPYPNSSHIEIGCRTQRDTKHYNTTYRNDLIFQGKQYKSSHPGIQAFKNKWMRSRLAK